MPIHNSPDSTEFPDCPQTYTLLTSSGSNKQEPQCCCLPKSPVNEHTSGIPNRALVEKVPPLRAFIYVYNHSPTYDHLTYDNPNLRSIFPKEYLDSRPTEFATPNLLRTFQFKLLIKLYLHFISKCIFIFLWIIYVTVILLHKYYWTNPLNLLEGVYFTPLIYFSLDIKLIQYQVFRKCLFVNQMDSKPGVQKVPVPKSDSTCNCTI